MPGRPVVFRTLDVGGDKPAAWQPEAEANPALGVRGMRLGCGGPALLDDQLARPARGRGAATSCGVMLPMVSTREELDQARERLEVVRAGLARADGPSRHGSPSAS